MQPPAQLSESLPRATSRAGRVFLGIIVLAILLGTSLFLHRTAPETSDPDAQRLATLAALQADDQGKLTTFAWTDRAEGRVQIPLASAMQLVLADLQTRKPAPAYPILDAADQPLSVAAPVFPEPADPLPAEQDGEAQIPSNVLSAPIEPPAKKSAKSKKPAKKPKKAPRS